MWFSFQVTILTCDRISVYAEGETGEGTEEGIRATDCRSGPSHTLHHQRWSVPSTITLLVIAHIIK